MLPILAGAAVIAGYGAYKFIRKCSVCGGRLSWTYDCIKCGESVCSSCSIEIEEATHRDSKISAPGHACSSKCKELHRNNCQSKIDKIEAEVSLRARAVNVKLYSENYKGKTRIEHNKRIASDYFRTIEEAEDQIKYIAATNDVDFVWLVQKKFVTQTDGNYKYKEWMLIGYI